MKKLISITTFALLVFAACTSKNAYIVTKSIDFENHMVDTTMLDFLRTRTKYPYIQDGWLFYSHAFPVPIDTPPHCHPDTSADTPLHSFLTDLDNIRITDLEYAGISTAALSVDPMIYRLDSASLVKYSKITNDAIAAAVKRHPDKYVGSICLPLPYLEESLAELDRAVNELGLDYFNTWSNYGDRHIYEEEFDPIFAKCAEYGIAVYLHPGIPGDSYLTDSGPSMASAGFGFTVDAMKSMLRLILGGVFDRYPNLTIIMGHMAEFFPYCLERMDNRFWTGAGAGGEPIWLNAKHPWINFTRSA